MKRIMFIALLACGLSVSTQSVQAAPSLLLENFESHTVNSWPSSWLKDANASSDPANNKIVIDPSDPSNKALQLYGRPDGNWAAIGYHAYTYSDHLSFSFRLFSGSGDTYGNQPGRGFVGIKNGPQWHFSTPGVALIWTSLVDNSFHGIGGMNLGSFEKETWYTVDTEYNRIGYDFSVSYRIDGVYKGVDTITTSYSPDTTFGYLQLHSGDRAALFDDIAISEMPSSPSIPAPSALLLVSVGLGAMRLRRRQTEGNAR